MNQLLPYRLFEGKNKWWLLVFAGLIFIAYQLDNMPRTDDEYLAEQVYWLLHEGKVKSLLGYHDLGYDTYQSIYHKLFIYCGYAFSAVAGWSLYTLHAVSFLSFILFLFIFCRYYKTNSSGTVRYSFFAALILLLFNQDLLYAAGDFRPEIMIMALGFAAYALLEKYLVRKKKGAFILSAVCAGLCMFAHLNGVIFIAAGCLVLLFRKKFVSAFLYAVIAGLVCSLYFTDVLYHADLAYFWNQFRRDPVLHAQSRHWYDPLFNLAREDMRFFFTEKQIILTASLVITLVFSFKKLKQSHATLLLYTLVLVVVLGLICPSKSSKYMVLYLPFLYIILAEGWIYIETAGITKKIITVRVLLLAGVMVSLFYSGRQIIANVENLRSGGLIAEHAMIAKKIPGPHKAMHLPGPRIMVFNLLEEFESLQDIEMIAKENLRAYISRSDITYVIFSKKDRAYFELDQLLREQNSPLLIKDSTAHYILTEVKH